MRYLSLFAFSEENWNRPDAEVTALMGLMVKAMAEEMEKLHRNGVRFMVLGNRARLSDEINSTVDSCMELTKDNDRLTMIIFLSCSGKWDIMQAALKMAEAISEDPGKKIEIENRGVAAFDEFLVTAGIPDPDLIIRTSGEQRISNYLLWQGAYSEFLFTDILWPDFRKKEFCDALAEYGKRDRRYGKVK